MFEYCYLYLEKSTVSADAHIYFPILFLKLHFFPCPKTKDRKWFVCKTGAKWKQIGFAVPRTESNTLNHLNYNLGQLELKVRAQQGKKRVVLRMERDHWKSKSGD